MQENVQKDNIAEIKMDAKNRLEHVEKKLSHNRITICFFYAVIAVFTVLTVCFILDKDYVCVFLLLFFVLFITLWISLVEKERQKLMEIKYVLLFLMNLPDEVSQSHLIEEEIEDET